MPLYQLHQFSPKERERPSLIDSVWEQSGERCRCRTSARPLLCEASDRFEADTAVSGDRGRPRPSRSASLWAGRRRCVCRRSTQRPGYRPDGLLLPPQGTCPAGVSGNLEPDCWSLCWTHTPGREENQVRYQRKTVVYVFVRNSVVSTVRRFLEPLFELGHLQTWH